MRILVITQKYDINDSNLGVFVDWWDRLAQRVERVYVLALEKRSESNTGNIQVESMGKEKGAKFAGKFLGFYKGFFKLIGGSDAILVHMIPKYVILAAPIAFILRKPIYMWYTGVSVHWQLRLAVIFCRKVFTAHEAEMRINTPKRIVTGHGIDVSKFKIQNSKFKINEPITIISVGRITPSKGHDLIIRVAADLIKAGYDLKMKLVGGMIQEYHREYADSLKKLAAELGINDRVEFAGAIPYGEMPQSFDNAEILINAVPFGGLDKVVLEAMASSLIPLTSNGAFLTVFPEAIGRDLIFKAGGIDDLKNKLKEILDRALFKNENLRHELRNIVIQNHNINHLIDRIVSEIK